ncbi:uncharacterized protein LOC141824901 [Curcuma longa]|uniref:uncharacterized protein LOC141824901 n=1 Tax=Curcuma longa TaxID=136217 RepID=UPI003D9F3867
MKLMEVHCDTHQHVDKPLLESSERKAKVRLELLRRLTNDPELCHNTLRVSPSAFVQLCNLLRATKLVKANKNSSVEEKVAKFLYLIAHDVTTRQLSCFFRRSTRTISTHFHEVLRAVISMHEKFIKQSDHRSELPPEIGNSSPFTSYFKDCIGAIDGIQVRVKIPSKDAPNFKGRKGWPTTDIWAACSFDLCFTYILTGSEETASDSRILKNAIIRDELVIPEGKFYLVDDDFMLKSNLLAPYPRVRYHLKEYSQCGPENAEELFNLTHASLHMAIKRAFGVLKKRFPIIASGAEPDYPIRTHICIIVACCILHNFLMGVDPNNRLVEEVDAELMNATIGSSAAIGFGNERQDEEFRRGMLLRENIARAMWSDYTVNELIKEKPQVKEWWTAPMHNYDKLYTPFAADRAAGEDVFAGAFFNTGPEEETPPDPLLECNGVNFIKPCGEGSPILDDQVPSKFKRKRSAMNETNDKKLQDSEIGLLRIATALEKGKLKIKEADNPTVEEFSRKEIFAELERLQVDSSKIIDAYLLLSADKEKTKTFFGAPEPYRLSVIYKMMSQL